MTIEQDILEQINKLTTEYVQILETNEAIKKIEARKKIEQWMENRRKYIQKKGEKK